MDKVVYLTDDYFNFINEMDPEISKSEISMNLLKNDCRELLESFRETVKVIKNKIEKSQLENFLKSANDSIHNLEKLQRVLSSSYSSSKALVKRYHKRLSSSFNDWVLSLEGFSTIKKENILKWKSLAPTN